MNKISRLSDHIRILIVHLKSFMQMSGQTQHCTLNSIVAGSQIEL